MPKSTLVLLPNLIAENTWNHLPEVLFEELKKITALIAENAKRGRQYLKHFVPEKMREMPMHLLNEHEDPKEVFEKLKKGGRFGLVSDAGLPCIADPGSELVALCHKEGIPVIAYPGPSSLFLALMLSGFSGQAFSFHGYLPRKEEELRKKLMELSKKKDPQIFIEAPYRSLKLLRFLIEHLPSKTRLFVGKDLCGKREKIASKTIHEWKKHSFPIGKEPAIYITSSK